MRSAGQRGRGGGSRAAGRGEDAGDGVVVEPGRSFERTGCVVGRERGPVRPVGDEGGEDVRGGQDAVAAGQRLGGERAVVPGAVDPLVVRRRRGDERSERDRSGRGSAP